MVRLLKDKKGQTSIEYLLLLLASFVTAMIMIRGPLSSFTISFLGTVRAALVNFTQTAEYDPEPINVGSPKHPSAPERFRAVHLE